MSAEVLAIIQKISLLAVLSDAERNIVAASGRVRRFAPGEEIVRQGDRGVTFYVVGSGQLEVWVTPPQSATLTGVAQVVQPILLQEIGPGAHFGEMSLLTGARRNATIKARTPAVIVELDRPVFMQLFQGNPSLVRQVTEEVSARNVKRHLKVNPQGSQAPATAGGSSSSGLAPVVDSAKDDLFSRIKGVFGLS